MKNVIHETRAAFWPLFIHAMARTGSTCAWSRIRQKPAYNCLYEPMNEASRYVGRTPFTLLTMDNNLPGRTMQQINELVRRGICRSMDAKTMSRTGSDLAGPGISEPYISTIISALSRPQRDVLNTRGIHTSCSYRLGTFILQPLTLLREMAGRIPGGGDGQRQNEDVLS